MTSELGTAWVRVRPNTAGFKGEVEQGVRGGLSGVGKLVGGAFAAAGAFEAVKHIAEAAAGEQAIIATTQKIVKNSDAAWVVHGQTVESILKKMAAQSGFSVEELAQGFGRLEIAFGDSDKALAALGAAEDLSRFRHIGLTAAALALSRAEQGKLQALSRLGVIIPTVTTHYDALKRSYDEAIASGAKFSADDKLRVKSALEHAKVLDIEASKLNILDAVQQRVGGTSAAFAKTAAGGFARFQVSVRELEIALGRGLLPELAAGSTHLADFFQKLSENENVTNQVKSTMHEIGGAVHEVVAVFKVLGPVASEAVGFIGGGRIAEAVIIYKSLGIAERFAATGARTLGASSKTAAAGLDTQAASAEAATVNTKAAGNAAVATAGKMRTAFKNPIAITVGIILGTEIAGADSGPLGWVRSHITDPIGHAVGSGLYDAIHAVSPTVTKAIGDVMLYSGNANKGKAQKAGTEVGAAFAEAMRPPDVQAAAAQVAAGNWSGVGAALNAEVDKLQGIADKAGKKAADALVDGLTDAQARANYAKAIRSVTGEQLGSPLLEGLIASIRKGEPGLASELSTSVREAVQQARLSIHDTFEQANANLASIAGGLGSRIGDVLDERLRVKLQKLEFTVGDRIRSLSERLSDEQAKVQSRDLRQAAADAAQGVSGIRHGASESAADFQARRKQAAEQLTSANRALREFEEQQTISHLQRVQDHETTSLTRREEAAKRSAERRVSDLAAGFNTGKITAKQLSDGLVDEFKKYDVTYKSVGALLGLAFATGFRAEVSGLGKQAALIGQVPRLPGVTGFEPTLVRPIDAVRAAIVQVASAQAARDNALLLEAKKTSAALAKIAKERGKQSALSRGHAFADTATAGAKP